MFSLIDRLNTALGRAVAWCMVLMALLTVTVVVVRYAFSTSTLILQESVLYLHGAAFMLAIPYTLKQGGHVRVDLIYGRLSSRYQALIDLIGHLLLLLPVSAFLFWSSLPYVASAWRTLEGSGDTGGIPAVFLLKTIIPVMAVLLFLQGVAECARCLRTWRGR